MFLIFLPQLELWQENFCEKYFMLEEILIF